METNVVDRLLKLRGELKFLQRLQDMDKLTFNFEETIILIKDYLRKQENG